MSASESLTLADVLLRVEEESLGALTGETARRVPAQTVLTQQPVHHALVDIWGRRQEGGGNTGGQLVGAGAALRPIARAQQPTHRRSSSPSGPPRSLRCTRTCTSSACSHTRRSGRCRGPGRTR